MALKEVVVREEASLSRWTQQEAIALCVELEDIAPKYGAHVALTGGCLYKSNNNEPRKDCDIVFYRIRQMPRIDYEGLFASLTQRGFQLTFVSNWCFKSVYQGKSVDLFFPEELTNVMEWCTNAEGVFVTEKICTWAPEGSTYWK